MTQEGDLVLVHMQENPAFFARVESITPDVKPEWFQVKMLVLQVPLAVVTWILRRPYIDGDEFTMQGTPIRMVKVVSPEEEQKTEPPSLEEAPKPKRRTRKKTSEETAEKGKVVSLFDRKKKDQQ